MTCLANGAYRASPTPTATLRAPTFGSSDLGCRAAARPAAELDVRTARRHPLGIACAAAPCGLRSSARTRRETGAPDGTPALRSARAATRTIPRCAVLLKHRPRSIRVTRAAAARCTRRVRRIPTSSVCSPRGRAACARRTGARRCSMPRAAGGCPRSKRWRRHPISPRSKRWPHAVALACLPNRIARAAARLRQSA